MATIPTTQTAVRVHKYATANAPADVRVDTDVEVPTPGEGEVLVRMRACPIHPADLISFTGGYPGFAPPADTLPVPFGLEGYGEVVALGPGCTGAVAVGARVTSGAWAGGSWVEYALSPEAALVPIPDSLPDDAAAQFLVNPAAAVGFLDVLKVPRGEWLLQTAASSALGLMVAQLCKARGIKTINVVRRADAAAAVEAAGGDAVVVWPGDDLAARVKALTGGAGAYAAVDAVGGAATAACVDAVRDNGEVLVYGVLSGLIAEVPIPALLFRGVRVAGFWLKTWISSDPATVGDKLGSVMSALTEGAIRPQAGRRFKLADAAAAIAAAGELAGLKGKVMLEM